MPPSNQSSTPLSPRPRLAKLLLSVAGLGFLGFADSAYLTADHYIALPLPCTVTHGCATVLTSPYSMVGPIPLALFGVAYYLAVFFFALYLYTTPTAPRLYHRALVGMTVIGLIMSIIFEGIQAFLIHAFCQYCALSALITLILSICGALMWRAMRSA